MSFELSFSPEFFLTEGEPYDVGPDRGESDRPDSVWQAILSMTDQQWVDCADAIGADREFMTPEEVLDAVRATNTCSNLNSPVEVWIDPEGDCRLRVYDNQKEEK